jgi:molecular chaperone DnaJ
MQSKDYYKILEVTPVASPSDIKKAFRRLALKYHPDKNDGDHLAAALFREAQEAYEVLSDPKQREEYHYKRWYNRSMGEDFVEKALTPEAILAECQQLRRYVDTMNIFQVDFNALSFHIRQLLGDTNQGILQQYGTPSTNRTIISNLLKAAHPLPLSYLEPVTLLMAKLAGNDEGMLREISDATRQRRRRDNWDKYKWMVVVVVVIAICWIMYEVGK